MLYPYSYLVMELAHVFNSSSVMEKLNLLPCVTFDLGANFWIYVEDFPIPLPPDVAKGMIVLFVRS